MGYLKVDLTKYRTYEPLDKVLKVDRLGSGNAISGAEYLGGKFLSGAGGKLVGAANLIRGSFYQITGNRYQAEKLYANNPVSKYAATLDELYNANGAMKFAGDVASGIGQNSVTALISLIPVVGSGLSKGINLLGYTGMGVEEAYAKTGKLDAKTYIYGAATGTMDSALEYTSGKIGGWLGKSAFGRGAASLSGKVSAGVMSASAKSGKLALASVAKGTLKSGLSEFGEEFIEAYAEVGLQRMLDIDPNASITFGQALYQGAVGFGSGAGMGAVSSGISTVSMQKYGRSVMGAGGTDTTITEAEEISKSYSGKTSPVIQSIKDNLALWEQIGNKESADAALVLGNLRMGVDTMEAYAIQSDAIERITKDPAKYTAAASQLFGKQVTEEDLSDPNGQYTRALALASFASGVLDRYAVKAKLRTFSDTIQKEATGISTVTALSAANFDGKDAIYRAEDGEYLIVTADKDGTYSMMWGEDTDDMEGASGLDEEQVQNYLAGFAREERIAKDAARAKAEAGYLKKKFSAEARAQKDAWEKITTDDGKVRYNLDESLGEQLRDWLSNGGKKGELYNGIYFNLGTTPDVFVKHGAKRSKMIMYGDVVEKVTGMKDDSAHNISIDEIAKLPSQLNDPILLFKGSVEDSFVALTELTDKQGNDVVVAVHIKKAYLGRSQITKIASLYSKTNSYGENKIISYVNNQIAQGNLIDASTKKASNWFTAKGLQLPEAVQTILDANSIISDSAEKVNTKSQKNSDTDVKYSLSEERNTENAGADAGGEVEINDAESIVRKAEGQRRKASREQKEAKARVNILKNEVQSAGRAAVSEYDAVTQDRARKIVGKEFDALSFERRVAIMDMLESASAEDEKTLRAVARILSGRKGLFLRFGADLNGASLKEDGKTDEESGAKKYVSDRKKNGFTLFSKGGRFIAISGETDAVRETVFHEVFHTVAYTTAGRAMIRYALGGMSEESAKERAIQYGELFHKTCKIQSFQKFLGKREFSVEEIYAYDAKYKDRMNGNTLAEEVASVFIGKNLGKSDFAERLAARGGVRGMLSAVKRFARYIRAHGEDREVMKYVRGLEKIYTAALAEDRVFGKSADVQTEGQVADTTRFSLIGRTEDGRGIYRSNYPKNTPKDVKQKDIVDLVQNVWSKKPIKLNLIVDGKTVPIEARFNPELTERSDLSKIAFGNRKGTASEKRITMNLSSDLYQIAEESRHVGSKIETGKDNAAHAGVTTWNYFITDLVYVEANGTEIECYMNIDVKQNDSGYWFYSFAIEKGSCPADVLSVVTDNSATTSAISITETGEKSNTSGEISSKNFSGTDIRYSLPETDSDGNKLSDGQREYFAGTKVTDENGKLLRVYHGSPAIFTEFSHRFMSTHGSMEGQGFYFTQNKDMAEGYSKKGGQLLEGYLSIKKPLSDSAITLTSAELKKLIQAIDPTGDDVIVNYDSAGGIGYPSKAWYNRALKDTVDSCMNYCDSDSEILANIANSGAGSETVLRTAKRVLGYDGYIVDGKYDNATIYVSFTSEQFKNADNKDPTENPDIRYALSDSGASSDEAAQEKTGARTLDPERMKEGYEKKIGRLKEKYREANERAREANRERDREKSRQRAATKAVILARELAEKITKRKYIPSKLLMAPEVQNFAAALSKVQFNYRLREPELRDAVKNLAGWYRKETFLDGENVMPCYSDEVKEAIVGISTGEGNLSEEEERGLAKILGNMDKILRDYDKVVVNGKRESATELAKKEVELLDRYIQYYTGRKKNTLFSVLMRRAKKFTRNMMYTIIAPEQVVMSLEQFDKDGVLTRLYRNVLQGETGMGAMYADLMTPFEDYFRKHKDYRKRLFRETVTIDGTEIGVGQAIALLLTSKRDQAKEGLELSGVRFLNADGETVRLDGQKTLSLLSKIPSVLRQEDREYIALVERFFGEFSTKIKTEADVSNFGYTNVTEGYYFPIWRDAVEIARKTTDVREAMREFAVAANQSFNKNTVKHAKNGLYIANVMDVVAKHANGLSVYANLYAPLSAWDMVWNRRAQGADGNEYSTREMVNDRIWTGERSGNSERKLRADKYFTKVFSDIQGVHAMSDGTDGIYNKLREMYTMSVLGLNPKVMLSQTASLPSALVCLSASSIAKGTVMKNDEKNMLAFSAVARARFFDKAYIEGEGNVRKGKTSGALQKVRDVSNAGIGFMDKFTILRLFNACKVEAERKYGYAVGTKENLTEAGKLLDEVIRKTQPTYTPGTRSALQRSDNAVMRTFSMFSSVAVKQLSYVFEGIGNFAATCHRVKMGIATEADKKAAWRGCARSLTALIAANVMYVIVCQIFKRLYAKDLDEGESIPEDMAGDMISVTLGMFPIISDTYDILINGYESGNFFYDAYNDIVTSVGTSAKLMAKMAGGNDVPSTEVARSTRDLLFSVCTLAGISGRNAYNFVSGITKRLSPSAGYTMSAFFGNASFSSDLAKAVERGDEKLAVKILELQLKNRRGDTSVSKDTAEELLALSEAGYDVAPPSLPSDIRKTERKKIESILAGADKTLSKVLGSEEYDAMTDEARAYTVRAIYRSYTEYAKFDVLEEEDLGVKSAFLMLMSDPAVYFAALGYISELKADIGKNRKPVAGSRAKKVTEYLNSLDLNESEKYMILYAAGFRSENVKQNLQKYIPRSGASDALKAKILSLISDEE